MNSETGTKAYLERKYPGVNMATHILTMANSTDAFNETNLPYTVAIFRALSSARNPSDRAEVTEYIEGIRGWAIDHNCATSFGHTIVDGLLQFAAEVVPVEITQEG